MSQIIVSSKELDRKKDSLVAIRSTLNTQIGQFESTGKKLDSMWDGPAKKKYALALSMDITKLKLLLKIIDEFISVLTKIIALYKLMEKKNVATASS